MRRPSLVHEVFRIDAKAERIRLFATRNLASDYVSLLRRPPRRTAGQLAPLILIDKTSGPLRHFALGCFGVLPRCREQTRRILSSPSYAPFHNCAHGVFLVVRHAVTRTSTIALWLADYAPHRGVPSERHSACGDVNDNRASLPFSSSPSKSIDSGLFPSRSSAAGVLVRSRTCGQCVISPSLPLLSKRPFFRVLCLGHTDQQPRASSGRVIGYPARAAIAAWPCQPGHRRRRSMILRTPPAGSRSSMGPWIHSSK